MADSINRYHLTKREKEVMDILWAASAPMVASDIARHGNKMTINTVQTILKHLLAAELIKVDKIVYSGNVLSRAFSPAITPEDFEIQRLVSDYDSKSSFSTSRFVSAMLSREKDTARALSEIAELEAMLKAKKDELLGE